MIQTLSNMIAYVQEGSVTQSVSVSDPIATSYAAVTCGAINLEISPTRSFLELTGNTINLGSDDYSDAPAQETVTMTAQFD